MVRLLSMRKRFSCLKPIDDAKTAISKRLREKRSQLLKSSIKKLKSIPDAECCLHRAVLIRNTYQSARQLSNEQLEQQIERERAEKENLISQTLCDDDAAGEPSDRIDLDQLFDFSAAEQTVPGENQAAGATS